MLTSFVVFNSINMLLTFLKYFLWTFFQNTLRIYLLANNYKTDKNIAKSLCSAGGRFVH